VQEVTGEPQEMRSVWRYKHEGENDIKICEK